MQESNGVTTIDCNYLFPGFAASYLVAEDGRAAFIENNTNSAVPRLLKALEDRHLSPDQVEYLIVTHIHLDHAGGTSSLLAACPRATVLAHPRAVPHIIDPSRIIAGATAVYGSGEFARLYGTITPVPAERVRAMEDGSVLAFGSREFRFLHTLGHAKHHFCVFDSGSNAVFTGDAFGLCYPLLQKGPLPFIFPSTSPTDFDPGEAAASVEKILATGAERVYLTHFGALQEPEVPARILIENIRRMGDILKEAMERGPAVRGLEEFCIGRVREFFTGELDRRKIDCTGDIAAFLEMDIELNGKGIAFTAEKKLKAVRG